MTPVWIVIVALASVTAILGALYGIVTRPMLLTLEAELRASESERRIELAEMETRLMKLMTEMMAAARASGSGRADSPENGRPGTGLG
jgi:hypothetical protein